MSFVKRHARLLVVAVGCLGAGAGASAIASAGASTPASKTNAAAVARRGLRAELRRAVHGDLVVPTRKGFVTVAFDRGFVQSVSGDSLTLREGTKKATYKTVTMTIPADARVRNNGARSSLSSLTAGERVGVLRGPVRTLVVARAVR